MVWNITSNGRCGMKNFRFNSHTTSLIATPNDKNWFVQVISDGAYVLKIKHKWIKTPKKIKPGKNTIILD